MTWQEALRWALFFTSLDGNRRRVRPARRGCEPPGWAYDPATTIPRARKAPGPAKENA